jgi:hypothetical protein
MSERDERTGERDPFKPDLVVLTEHGSDLPPKWDGQDIEWTDWDISTSTLARFHTPPTACPGCGGDSRQQPHSVGVVQPREGETFKSYKPRTLKRTGRVVSREVEVPAWPVVRFVATRCRTCRLDHVYDIREGSFWRLDASDYGPNGSVA